jgi:hypothetical protein
VQTPPHSYAHGAKAGLFSEQSARVLQVPLGPRELIASQIRFSPFKLACPFMPTIRLIVHGDAEQLRHRDDPRVMSMSARDGVGSPGDGCASADVRNYDADLIAFLSSLPVTGSVSRGRQSVPVQDYPLVSRSVLSSNAQALWITPRAGTLWSDWRYFFQNTNGCMLNGSRRSKSPVRSPDLLSIWISLSATDHNN